MNARLLSTSLLLILVAGAAACANESEAKRPWACGSTDVPGGEVIRCTQSAVLIDETIGSPEPCSGATDTEACTSYECTAGDANCPSTEASGGAGGTSPAPGDNVTTAGGQGTTPGGAGGTGGDGTTTGGGTTGGAGATNGPGNSSAKDNGGASNSGGSTGGSGATGGSGTTGGSGATDGPGNSSAKDNGGASKKGPEECAWVEEVCSSGGSGSTGSGSGSTGAGSGSTGSGSGSENGSNPGAKSDGAQGNQTPGGGSPGQEKKNGDGASSDSGGSSSSNGGGRFKCVEDKKGNRKCESIPVCVPGTHPSACGACVPDGESGDCVPPSDGGCWVTGGGFIIGPNVTTGAAPDGHDNFGGNAKPMKDGRIQGHWNHVDHGTKNHAKGRPEYIVCRHVDEPGPGQPGGKKGFTMNQVYFGGHAEWQSNDTWASGYWFDVVAKDHGEPGSVPHVKNGFMPDTYHFTIRLMDDPTNQVSGAIVYETKGVLEGGNIQMHPPNNGHPYTPMSLPSWVAFEP